MKALLWSELRRLLPPVSARRAVGLGGLVALMLLAAALPTNLLDDLTLRLQEPSLAASWGAHFIHLNYQHLLMNVAGFTVIWLLTVAFVPLRWVLALTLMLPPVVSYLLVMTSSGNAIESYRGFSGILYGYWLCGIIWSWSRQAWIAAGCLAVLIGKIVLEQRPDFDLHYLEDTIGGLVAVDAHLWGAVAGGLLAGVFMVIDKIYVLAFSSERLEKGANS